MKKLLILLGLFPLLSFGGATSGGGAGGGSGTITGVTGTSGNILVNGGTTPVTSGAVTLILPPGLTGISSITAPASTDLTLNSGSGNQNIQIISTGTGMVIFGALTGTPIDSVTLVNGKSFGIQNNAGTNRAFSITSNSSDTINFRNASGIWLTSTAAAGLNIVFGGSIGVAGQSTLTGGVVNLPASTSAAGGIAYGADLFTYRSGASQMAVASSTGAVNLFLYEGASQNLQIQSSGGAGVINVINAATLTFRTSNANSVTIDSTHGTTFVGKAVSTSATAGVGYATGAGGVVVQATNKATGVTLNTVTGQVTMVNSALASATSVIFTLTDSAIAAADNVDWEVTSGTSSAYTVQTVATSAGSCNVSVTNTSGGSLSEAIVIHFVVIKGANS